MTMRGIGKTKTAAVYIAFSDDAIHWDPPQQLKGLDKFTTYPQRSGLIGVPGGLLLSHGGGPGTTGLTSGSTGKGDGGGMDLFASVDGLTKCSYCCSTPARSRPRLVRRPSRSSGPWP